jgi:hypothetical protein
MAGTPARPKPAAIWLPDRRTPALPAPFLESVPEFQDCREFRAIRFLQGMDARNAIVREAEAVHLPVNLRQAVKTPPEH